MDLVSLLIGAGIGVGAVVLVLAGYLLARKTAPAAAPPSAAPPSMVPAPSAPAAPPPATEAAPPAASSQPVPQGPNAVAPQEPALRLVAYRCPQCGADVDLGETRISLRCAYCDASIRVEGQRAGPRPSRPRPTRERKPPFEPTRQATLSTVTFGRFQVTVLRQGIHEEPREVLRWLPLDERRGALLQLRVVSPDDSTPRGDRDLLETLSTAAVGSLRERRDPGLAAKAALRALQAHGDTSLGLELFAAVFDAEQSTLVTTNAGCRDALTHCHVEDPRPVNASRDRGLLRLNDLTDPEAFANQGPRHLAGGDVVVVTSAGVAGDGRGWKYGTGCSTRALRELWPAERDSAALSRAIKDRFWTERERASHSWQPPVGDVLVVTVAVKSNLELEGAASLAPPPETQTFTTRRFGVALAPRTSDHVHFERGVRPDKHFLVWLGEAPGSAREAFVATIRERLDAANGDTRRAGKAALETSNLGAAPALVLYLDDEHGKVSFWTQGWGGALQFLARGERGGNMQRFSGGGDAWLKPGGRLLFPGTLPLRDAAAHNLESLASAWAAGKASALYEACRDHEDHADSAAFLGAALGSARTDHPDCDPEGVCVVGGVPGA